MKKNAEKEFKGYWERICLRCDAFAKLVVLYATLCCIYENIICHFMKIADFCYKFGIFVA